MQLCKNNQEKFDCNINPCYGCGGGTGFIIIRNVRSEEYFNCGQESHKHCTLQKVTKRIVGKKEKYS